MFTKYFYPKHVRILIDDLERANRILRNSQKNFKDARNAEVSKLAENIDDKEYMKMPEDLESEMNKEYDEKNKSLQEALEQYNKDKNNRDICKMNVYYAKKNLHVKKLLRRIFF